MLEKNVDTYITIGEADEYAGKYYLAADEKSIAWFALSDAEKEIALRNAAMSIDSVAYPGRKKSADQPLEFPRCYKNGYFFPLNWYETYTKQGTSWHCMVDVPEKVKQAQAEEALEIICPGLDSDDFAVRNSNLTSFSVTGLSETYSGAVNAMGDIKCALRSGRAQRWISKYVGGGYHVD